MFNYYVCWAVGVFIFLISIIWHYKKHPDDALPIWGTMLIIWFWFIALPIAILILFSLWVDIKFFSKEDDIL